MTAMTMTIETKATAATCGGKGYPVTPIWRHYDANNALLGIFTLAYFGNGDVCLAYAASWVGLEVRCEMEVKWVHHETRVLASKGINLIHVEQNLRHLKKNKICERNMLNIFGKKIS